MIIAGRKPMDCKRIFSNARTPKPENFSGEYAVKLVVPFLPDLRFLGHKKHIPDAGVEQGGGTNVFLNRVRLGNFRMATEMSAYDGLEVTKIIYDHPANPIFMRPLTDEIREVNPGYYLCRGIYSIVGKPVLIMYFTLTKIE
jgi:hypothetical protein